MVGGGERDPANDGAPGMVGQALHFHMHGVCHRCVIIVLIFMWVVLCTNLCTYFKLQRTYVCPASIFIALTRLRFQVSLALLVKPDEKFVFVCGMLVRDRILFF